MASPQVRSTTRSGGHTAAREAALGHAGPGQAALEHTGARQAALERAVLEALAYADVFDWPLTPFEVHAFLPIAADPGETRATLRTMGARPAAMDGGPTLAIRGGLVALAGREHLFATRRQREATSARLWTRAAPAAAAVAALPLVRMVAVTGSLAANAADADADVDLFVVTEDGRLWLTRAMAMGVVRTVSLGGVRLCPNYLLAESRLELPERDLFSAHELARMVPVSGFATFRELLERNDWYRAFLPNHPGSAPPDWSTPPRRPPAARLVERALRSGLLEPLERWEMGRKVARLAAQATSTEQRFDATVCKGHFEEHGRATLEAFRARLATLNDAVAPGDVA